MIRAHMKKHIGDRYSLDTACDTFPADSVQRDPEAYLAALRTFEKGDVAIVTTPDQTHFPIAMKVLEAGLHVLVGPFAPLLAHHIPTSPHPPCTDVSPRSPFPSPSPSPLLS